MKHSTSTSTSARRKFSRRGLDGQYINKTEAEMPFKNDATALLGEKESKRYSTGYLTVRDDKQNFVSYADGEEVMRGDEFGAPPEPPQSPRRSVSVRRLHQVKQSVSESIKPLTAVIERVPLPSNISRKVSKREKKKAKGEEAKPVIYAHAPLIVYGHPERPLTKMETYIQKSKTLASIASSVKRLSIRPKPKVPPNRDWDNRGKEPVYITNTKRADVHSWTEEQVDHDDEQQLVALTSCQLKELQGKSADTVIYASSTYMVPNPTPCGSDAGSIHEDEDDEGDLFGRPEDADPQAEHKYLHKDLRKLLGPQTGFYIAPGSGNKDLFFQHNNYSPYYHEPLIGKGRDPNTELISFVNMIDKEFSRDAAAENGYDFQDSDDYSSASYNQTQNSLQRPRSQLPGQALLQYLLFKGLPISTVANLLSSLDETLLYKAESRWWKGYRIPQHTQLNDRIVEKVLGVAKAPKEWWEEEFDVNGRRMPKAQVTLHMRQRERKVVRFAKKSVENYFWWRLVGEQPHGDVKSGAMMRDGEY